MIPYLDWQAAVRTVRPLETLPATPSSLLAVLPTEYLMALRGWPFGIGKPPRDSARYPVPGLVGPPRRVASAMAHGALQAA